MYVSNEKNNQPNPTHTAPSTIAKHTKTEREIKTTTRNSRTHGIISNFTK